MVYSTSGWHFWRCTIELVIRSDPKQTGKSWGSWSSLTFPCVVPCAVDLRRRLNARSSTVRQRRGPVTSEPEGAVAVALREAAAGCFQDRRRHLPPIGIGVHSPALAVGLSVRIVRCSGRRRRYRVRGKVDDVAAARGRRSQDMNVCALPLAFGAPRCGCLRGGLASSCVN